MSVGAKYLTWPSSNVAQSIHKFVIFVAFCQWGTTHALPTTLAPYVTCLTLTFYRLWLSYRKTISDYYQVTILCCTRQIINLYVFQSTFWNSFSGFNFKKFLSRE